VTTATEGPPRITQQGPYPVHNHHRSTVTGTPVSDCSALNLTAKGPASGDQALNVPPATAERLGKVHIRCLSASRRDNGLSTAT